MRRARLFQLIKQMVLHLNRMMQFPTELPGIGHPDRPHRHHPQLDVAHGQPGEPLVAQHRVGLRIAHQIPQHITRLRPSNRKNSPLRGHVMTFDITHLGHLIGNRLAQVIAVIGAPRPRRDQIILILRQPHDGIFRPRRPCPGQRIGQVNPPHRGQLVAGEPIQESRCPRPAHQMLSKGRGINQPHPFANGFRLVHRVLPPAPAPERAAVMVAKPLRRKIIRPLPAVHLPELRPPRRLPIICRRGPQRPTGRTFLIRMVQDINVIVGFLVLPRGIFRGHPIAVALGIEACHIDLGFALNHHLRQIIAGAPRSGDPKRKPFRQPHIPQPRRWSHQRITIRRVTNRPVEIVLQPAVLSRGDAVVHRHILIFDPLQIQLKQIRPETIRHPIFKPRRRVLLIDP